MTLNLSNPAVSFLAFTGFTLWTAFTAWAFAGTRAAFPKAFVCGFATGSSVAAICYLFIVITNALITP